MATNKINVGVELTGDAKGAVSSTKATSDSIKKLNEQSKRAQGSFSKFGKQVQAARSQLNMMSKVAITAGVGLTTALVKKGLESADALAKTADKLGVTTEALASLRFAAEQTGVGQQKLDIALQRMTRRLVDASAGTGPAVKAFKALRLSANDLIKLSPDQAFAKIADQMNKVESQSAKVAIAFKLFDSEGVDLVRTAALGSEGLAEMAKQAEAAGLAISRTDAAAIEEANDAINLATKQFQGFSMHLAREFAPILTKISEEFFRAGSESGGMAEAAGKAFNYILRGVGVLADGVRGLVLLFKIATTALHGIVTASLSGFDLVAQGVAELASLIPGVDFDYENSGFAAFVTQMQRDFKGRLGEIHDLAMQPIPSQALEEWVADSERSFKAGADAAEEGSKRTTEAVGQVGDAVISTESVIEALGTTTKETAKEMKESADPWAAAWQDAVARIDSAFSGMWKDILDGGKLSFDGLKDAFKSFLSELLNANFIRPITSSIGAAFGIGSAGASASAGGGLLGGAGLLSNLSALPGLIGGGLYETIGGGIFNTLAGISPNAAASFGTQLGTYISNPWMAGAALGGGIVGNKLSGELFSGRDQATGGLLGAAGATIGAFTPAGPLGALVGAFVGDALDRALGGSDFSGKRVKLGVTAGGRAEGGFDFSETGASGLELGLITRRTNNIGMSNEDERAFLDAFLGLDAGLTAISDILGANIDLSGVTLTNPNQRPYDGGLAPADFFGSLAKGELDEAELAAATGEFVQAWLDATIGQFPEQLQPFIQQLEGSADEVLQKFGMLADAFQAFEIATSALQGYIDTNPFEQVAYELAIAGSSAQEVWRASGEAIQNFVDEGGADVDLARLTTMVSQRYELELNLVRQLMTALEQASGFFDSTIQNIEFSLLDRAGQRSFLTGQIANIQSSISGLGSAEEVTAALQSIDSLANRLFSLAEDVAPGQDIAGVGREAMAEFIINTLRETEGLATGRINELIDEIKTDRDPTANGTAAAIKQVLQESGDILAGILQDVVQQELQQTNLLQGILDETTYANRTSYTGEVTA
jgi:hypothetical protein